MKKFAVFGNPITHSLSPEIHQMFAHDCGMDIEYTRQCAGLETFEQEVSRFLCQPQTIGCNVTVPFKERAYKLSEETDDAAGAAGAVNTLMRRGNKVLGYNTDGVGLVRDLRALDIALAGKTITLLGAGGAARGVIHPLISAGVSQITIVNRTYDKALALVEAMASPIVRAEKAGAVCTGADLVINSTSASLTNELPVGLHPDMFQQCELAYDMVYGDGETAFMNHAREQGATRQADGLGMLVEQAAEAFRIWTGCDPRTDKVKLHLRNRVT